MKLAFNQSTETIISNKELNISPGGGEGDISPGTRVITNGDGGSVGIKPAI